MAIPRVLKEVLTLPTAAFVENAVIDYVRRTCAAWPAVKLSQDRWGNLLARYRNKPRRARPLVFTAHMDHPGFCAIEMHSARELIADFRGWVETPYFVGTPVRFWSHGRWVRGTVREVLKETAPYRMIGRSARPEQVLIELSGEVPAPVGALRRAGSLPAVLRQHTSNSGSPSASSRRNSSRRSVSRPVSLPVAPNSPGMWDLPDPMLRDGKVYARACDDLAGVASMLALLERLSKKQAQAECYCLFTRAEEVGFIGAIGAAKARTIPHSSPVIAIETSKMLANAPQGAGPILRVGDKTSIFTPEVTAFGERIAQHLREKRKSFQFQRKLMDGGTCESTAYIVYGYAATGVCVALGNYHNMNEQTRRIDSEYIDLQDWKSMVDWFEAMVLDERGYTGDVPDQRKTFDERFRKAMPLLK